MNLKTTIITCLIAICLLFVQNIPVNGQYYRLNADTNFQEIMYSFYENYNGSIDTFEGSEFRRFQRWESFWKPRLSPSGSFQLAQNKINDFIASYDPADKDSEYTSSNWQEIGPNVNGISGIGLVNDIEFHPTNPNILYCGSSGGGVWKTTDGGQNWFNLNTDSQLARLGVSTIVVDPTDPDIIYIGTGDIDYEFSYSDGVYRSIDGGINWEPINNGLFSSANGLFLISKILVDGDNGTEMYVAGTFGIYKCDNRKAANPTWYKVYPTTPTASEFVRNIHFEPGDNDVIYGTGINIIISENNGILGSWQSIATASTNLDFTNTPTPNAFAGDPDYYLELTNMAVGPNNDYLYVSMVTRSGPPPYNWSTPDSKRMYRYDLNTELWERCDVENAMIYPYKHEIAVDPLNDNTLYAGGIRVYKSINAGDDWTFFNTGAHADYHSLEFSPFDNNILFCCTDGGIWKKNVVTGASDELNNGLGVATLYYFGSSEIDPDQILSGMQDCGLNYYKNNLWTHEVTSDGFECVLDYNDVDIMYGTSYAGGNGNIHRSTNDANNPTFLSGINYDATPSYFGAPLVIHPNDHKVLYQGRRDLMKTDDATIATSSSWYPVSDFITLLNNEYPSETWYQVLYGLSQCLTDENYIYTSLINAHHSQYHQYNDCVLVKTENGGGTTLTDWSIVTPPGERYFIRDLEVSPHNPDHIWVAYSSYEAPIKVKRSLDGGTTWQNFGEGLPDLPVNCIVYEFGSNDGLFVGTDVGVYYRDNSLSQWEPFMDNLPNVVVNWLEINYTANKIRAGTFGRGTWESDLSCEGDSEHEIAVDYDQTWDRNAKLSSNVSVQPGNTLTIKGIVNCMEDVKIKVKPGAKLILDGGKLTNICDEMWQGIEVHGDITASQYPDASGNYSQGYLELKNGASIENANNAVTLWEQYDWTSMGGIVKATEANFINNRRSVEFMSYQNFDPNSGHPAANLSAFEECYFEVNNDYRSTVEFAYHVSMWEVDGVKYRGCEFQNLLSGKDKVGYGIYTMDAEFQAIPTQTFPPVPSTFEGFYAGINALNSQSLHPIYVYESIFEDNGFGVKLSKSDYATIIFNEFNIGSVEAPGCADYGVGVELLNCNDYAVEENEFSPSASITGSSIGVLNIYEENYANIAGVKNNQIYLNIFDGVTIGNEAIGVHKMPFTLGGGLSYQCNLNSNNRYDFYIEEDGIPIQGRYDKAAGNTFTQDNTYSDGDIYNNSSSSLIYFYDDNVSAQEPLYYTSNVLPRVATDGNACLSNYRGVDNTQTKGLGLTAAEQNTYEQIFDVNQVNFNGTLTLFENLKDGGDTEGVVIEIETSWPSEMLALRATLLANSPHLSKRVLMATADNTSVFPDAVIFEILAANPDEMRDEEFLDYLAEKQDPLPQYYIDILRGLAGEVSYKTILQCQLMDYRLNMAQAADIIVRNMLNDSICNMDTVRNWLGSIGSFAAECQIIDSYLQEKDATNAQTTLSNLISSVDLAPEDSVEFNRYVDLKTLQIDLITEGRNIFLLDSTEKVQLESIAENSVGIAGTQAQNILAFVYGQVFTCCPEFPDTTYKNTEQGSIIPADLPAILTLKVFPNPASNWTAFEYELPVNDGNVFIRIYNAKGQLEKAIKLDGLQGQKIWDVQNVNPGVYSYILELNEEVNSGKLIVQ